MPTTHPHPALIDPSNWCSLCRDHLAVGMLCPVCLDDKVHGLELTLSRPTTTINSRGN